jgi:hypothetical protein
MTNMWNVFPPPRRSISCPKCIRRIVVAGTGDRVFRSECQIRNCPINNDPENRVDNLWGTSISFELPSEISQEGRIAIVAGWEKQGLEAIKTDLSTGGSRYVRGPPAVRDLAWEWIGTQEANIPTQLTQKSERLSFKSIKLRDLAQRGRRFWRSRFK